MGNIVGLRSNPEMGPVASILVMLWCAAWVVAVLWVSYTFWTFPSKMNGCKTPVIDLCRENQLLRLQLQNEELKQKLKIATNN